MNANLLAKYLQDCASFYHMLSKIHSFVSKGQSNLNAKRGKKSNKDTTLS